MTPDDLDHVQRTARVLLSVGPSAFDAFYDTLFTLAPETRALFRGDMAAQKLKLLDMIASLIGATRDFDRIAETAYHLGTRHARYGVTAEHWAVGERALAACLTAALGPDFTPEVRAAWLALYGLFANAMTARLRTAAIVPPPIRVPVTVGRRAA